MNDTANAPTIPATGAGAPAMVATAGLDPPTDADALALTFAQTVAESQ